MAVSCVIASLPLPAAAAAEYWAHDLETPPPVHPGLWTKMLHRQPSQVVLRSLQTWRVAVYDKRSCGSSPSSVFIFGRSPVAVPLASLKLRVQERRFLVDPVSVVATSTLLSTFDQTFPGSLPCRSVQTKTSADLSSAWKNLDKGKRSLPRTDNSLTLHAEFRNGRSHHIEMWEMLIPSLIVCPCNLQPSDEA